MSHRLSAASQAKAPRISSLLRWLVVALAAAFAAAIAPGTPSPRPVPALAGVPANFTVDSNADGGDASPGDLICDTGDLFPGTECTLRAAIEEVNAGLGLGDAINFSIVGSTTIVVTQSLPYIQQPVTIDGTTQCASPPCVRLGAEPFVFGYGLVLEGGTSTVKGMMIGGGFYGAILLQVADGNTVTGNHIGSTSSGDAFGNILGIVVGQTSANNTIGGSTAATRNVISGNNGDGLLIESSGNSITGNYIGTDVSGTVDIGNVGNGIMINTANGNTIGSASAPNVISGNDSNGVSITGNQNVVRNNNIGLNAAQTAGLGNSQNGIIISSGTANIIGGDGAYQVVSGNGGDGVQLTGSATANTEVRSNLIGLNGAGAAAIANGGNGVRILAGAHDNNVGTAVNAISGNTGHGVLIEGASTINNVIYNSRIGTDLIGAVDIGNGGSGIHVSGTGANRIGGDNSIFWPVISGNQAYGIAIVNSTGVVIWGTYTGTDAAGAADLGNTLSGVLVMASTNTRVGGATAGKRSIISGNDLYGVYLVGSITTTTHIEGNYIGLNAAGTATLPNGTAGILMSSGGAINNTVGGTLADQRNVISGHSYAGVWMTGGATSNTVQGNYIGTNATGTAALGNGTGVFLENTASGNAVGGTAAGAGNLVSGNSGHGIFLASDGNTVHGNRIGTDAAGTAPLGNGTGIFAVSASNTIGGTAAGASNTIAYNGFDGVQTNGAGATGNAIRGNSIHHHNISGGLGIRNFAGGNAELPPPAFTSIAAGTVTGTACADCTVDVYSEPAMKALSTTDQP